VKSGFVAVLGRPNAGKSTLLNALVGSKIAIVTDKPQTTRDAIQGIVTSPEGQIVLVDSPGVHKPHLELGRRMMREVHRATSGCHLVLLLADASAGIRADDRAALDIATKANAPVLLVLNKIDLVIPRAGLLPLLDQWRQLDAFEEYVPVSALTGENLDLLVRLIFQRLPEAPPFYPEDFITDQPERFLAAELIREQVIVATGQEVPHSTAVLIEQWTETPTLLRIGAAILVEREGQKRIVIGAGGQKLKQIGTAARLQLEAQFRRKVYLELFVKVRTKWRDKPSFVRELDFRRQLGEDSAEEAAGWSAN
jgi:GTP-binding protein Era